MNTEFFPFQPSWFKCEPELIIQSITVIFDSISVLIQYLFRLYRADTVLLLHRYVSFRFCYPFFDSDTVLLGSVFLAGSDFLPSFLEVPISISAAVKITPNTEDIDYGATIKDVLFFMHLLCIK